MGLLLEISLTEPFPLNIGLTEACLQSWGNDADCRE